MTFKIPVSSFRVYLKAKIRKKSILRPSRVLINKIWEKRVRWKTNDAPTNPPAKIKLSEY
jgi:hypothetical protein